MGGRLRVHGVGEEATLLGLGGGADAGLELVGAGAADDVGHAARGGDVVRAVARRLDLVGGGRAQGGGLPQHVEAVHGVEGLAVVAPAHPPASDRAGGVVDELGVDAVPAGVGEGVDEVDLVDLLDVGGAGFRQLDFHVFHSGGRKAGGRRSQVVKADRNIIEPVLAVGIALGRRFDSGGRVRDLDGSVGHRAPAGIRHGPHQVGVDRLCVAQSG